MSVLLDALKKAALEKQKRDQGQTVQVGSDAQLQTVEGSEPVAQEKRAPELDNRENGIEVGEPDSELGESLEIDAELSAESNLGAVSDEATHELSLDDGFLSEGEEEERLEIPIDIDEEHLDEIDDSIPTLDDDLVADIDGHQSAESNGLDFDDELLAELPNEVPEERAEELSDEMLAVPDIMAPDESRPNDAIVGIDENGNLESEILSQSKSGPQEENDSLESNSLESNPQESISPKSVQSSVEPRHENTSQSNSENTLAESGASENSADRQEDSSGKKSFTKDERHSADYFKQLLESNKQDIKRRRKKFVVLFALCIVFAILTVVSYFYYSIVIYQPPMAINPIAIDSTGNVQQYEDSNLQTGDGIADGEVEGEVEGIADAAENVATQSSETVSGTLANTQGAGSQTSETENAIQPAPQPVSKVTQPVVRPKKKTPSVRTPQRDTAKRKSLKQRIEVSEPVADPLTLAIEQGYTAYNRGEFELAAEAYRRALSIAPESRDAILGAAAVASINGQYENALVLYQRQLSLKPNDDYAHSGMLSILSVESISPELFSKVNELLSTFPEAAHLHFLKGRMLVKQSRWSAAQMSFFNAWSRSSDRADYAYNLAISLDNLALPEEALTFYKRSLTLAKTNMYGVDVGAVRRRIEVLEGAVNE